MVRPSFLKPTRTLCSLCVVFALLLCGCEQGPVPPVEADPDSDSDEEVRGGGGGASGGGGGGGFPVAGSSVTRRKLATDPEGQSVYEYQLTNSHGMQVSLINWGAAVIMVRVPDRNDKYENVTLSFEKVESYFEPGPYFGAICGRYSNRIAGGIFKIGETQFKLATNNDTNHLHGGIRGFNRRFWKAEKVKNDGTVGVKFHLESPDGEENYPGTLSIDVTYWLTERSELKIEYEATTDKPTVLNLTNHCYWNLGGAGSGDILGHELTLDCQHYLPVDKTLIPTGDRATVSGTPMDFLSPQPIGSRIEKVEGGYDHCYTVTGADGSLKRVAQVHDPKTGRVMEILTTEPGIQFYTGNFLDGEAKNGGFPKHGAFCLESQHFPDSPNQPDFPTTLLKPGETYHQTTVHRFSVRRARAPGEGGGGRGGKRKSSGGGDGSGRIGSLIERLDKDKDGKIGKEEASFLSRRFDSIDANSDGFIESKELDDARKRAGGSGRSKSSKKKNTTPPEKPAGKKSEKKN